MIVSDKSKFNTLDLVGVSSYFVGLGDPPLLKRVDHLSLGVLFNCFEGCAFAQLRSHRPLLDLSLRLNLCIRKDCFWFPKDKQLRKKHSSYGAKWLSFFMSLSMKKKNRTVYRKVLVNRQMTRENVTAVYASIMTKTILFKQHVLS